MRMRLIDAEEITAYVKQLCKKCRENGWTSCCACTINKILNHIADVPPVDAVPVAELPRWIPVEERLPKNWERVVFRTVSGCMMIGCQPDSPDSHWEPDRGFPVRFENVTHWMPLPEPPKEGTHE